MSNIFSRLFSKSDSGTYHTVYIKKDEQYISLEDDTTAFCDKWIRPVHPENWDWGKRDFTKEENDPTIEEARAVRQLLIQDMDNAKDSQIDLTTLDNSKSLEAFFAPDNPHEEYNMNEFAYALKVELEHGRIKDANVTNNHPFLTAMIVLAHMSETTTYYKRLKVMETEGEIFEYKRKIKAKGGDKDLEKELKHAEEELITARLDLEKRLMLMDEIPVQKEIGD